MSIQCLPGGMASGASRATAQEATSVALGKRIAAGGSFREVVNDGVVATSSVLLIGSFFWVGAELLAVAYVGFTEIYVLTEFVGEIFVRQLQRGIPPHHARVRLATVYEAERVKRKGEGFIGRGDARYCTESRGLAYSPGTVRLRPHAVDFLFAVHMAMFCSRLVVRNLHATRLCCRMKGARMVILRVEKQMQDSKAEGSVPRLLGCVSDHPDAGKPENSQAPVVEQVQQQ